MQPTGGILTLASPGYFEAAGTRLLRGRTFEPTDRRGGERVAVVNDTMARLITPDGNVVGLCVPFNGQVSRGACTHIVGVVESQPRFYLDDEPQPLVFLVWAQSPNAVPLARHRWLCGRATPRGTRPLYALRSKACGATCRSCPWSH
jgi:MacB-like periplasmic core domain